LALMDAHRVDVPPGALARRAEKIHRPRRD